MDDRILILGNGQMGNFYNRYFQSRDVHSYITGADITDETEVRNVITEFDPTVVINTAAKTNLEWCSNNKLEAFNVNVLGADNIAHICDERGIYFIHLSSGCIFESKDEHDAKSETDIPEPASYYSWTKVWAEQMIQFNKSEEFSYLILRPRQPISSEVNYKNMLVKFLTFTQFVDTPNTGTSIEDLMDWTLELMQKREVGVVNAANEGVSTPYRIAELLKKHVLPELPTELISKEELDKRTPNKRIDTVLNVDKLKSLVSEIKPYEERLEEIIRQLAENIKNDDRDHLKEQLEKTLEQTKLRATPNNVWSNLIK